MAVELPGLAQAVRSGFLDYDGLLQVLGLAHLQSRTMSVVGNFILKQY